MDLLILLTPSINSVYASAAKDLAVAETRIVLDDWLVGEPELEHVANVPYIRVKLKRVDDAAKKAISLLSFCFCVFERKDGVFLPFELPITNLFPDDLLSILKYRGKTNTMFTKMMMNIATHFARPNEQGKLYIFDPMCGRGTTLNQALMLGHNVAGMDIDEKDCDLYRQFLSRWLKDHRIKHKMDDSKLRSGKRTVGMRSDSHITVPGSAPGSDQQRVTILSDDTRNARLHFKRDWFDAIITDLPYGIAHGAQGKEDDLSRRPLELLDSALAGWLECLKPLGVVVLSWNTKVAGREKLLDVLEKHHLTIIPESQTSQFRHVVDQSIVRDVAFARKT